ncbi:hypothetical protein PIB30_037636 [Stylosanthes scabra]|uniref:Pentatricopeptide repeat-containing protein n=1 Tax=Stylosanthes scabra TaxID=79078 RepID=A0ABU6REG2_9FABA|nr:hypothetical protein [Stylosanthes scabra]
MNYNRLISGGSRLLRRLCTAATEAPPPPKNKASLYRKISSLNMTGGSVSQTLNQYVMEGNAISKRELERFVVELRKYRKFQHALEIMEWLESRKINFALNDYAVYLDLVSKTKGVDAAENYFNGLPPHAQNKFTYGALLNCYCKELMTEKALAHFGKMDELHYVTNLALNNLMTLFMRLGQPEKVPQQVEDMKQRKIPLNEFTYHIWMNSLGNLNDIDGVERVFDEMKRENSDKIDWHTYCNLASIYVKAKQFEKAESMLKMLEEKAKPSMRDAYHFMLYLYAGTSNPQEVYRVWISLKTVSPVTNTSYLTMMRSLRKLNDMEGIIKCFEEWESNSASYDIRLVNIAVSAYLSQNLVEEAESLFKEATCKRKGPFFKIRELFMIYYLEKRQLDNAMSYLEALVSESEWHPTPELVGAFLKYYEETDLDGVEELCKIFKSYNYNDSWITTYIKASEVPDSQENHETENLKADVHSG